MKILITGGCGFIGSFFTEELRRRYPDATLVVLDALYDCASEANIAGIPGVKFYKGNLQNKDLLSILFQQYSFDWVAHLAAQTHVDTSFHTPLQFTYDNVIGTHTLLEVIRESGCVKRMLYVSTDEVYGSTSDHSPNTVDSLLEPSNPYAATKASAEMLVKSYAHSFGLNAFIVRMNNVYGPRQYPEKMVPRFIHRILEGKPLQIQGSGKQKRSMLYVEDAAKALVCVLEQAAPLQIVNVPSRDEISVLEAGEAICHLMEAPVRFEFVADRNFNDRRYWIHDTVLEGMGWRQETSFREGLRKTIDWYSECDFTSYWSRTEHHPQTAWSTAPSELYPV
jgi:UDP-glucose 4,6-dehydratase